jgi:polysaccharide export outer membrane protein
MYTEIHKRKIARRVLPSALMAIALAQLLSGCGSFLASAGISTAQVVEGPNETLEDSIKVVPVDARITRRVKASTKRLFFSNTLGSRPFIGNRVGRGDVLEVSVWEAPPATLFGTSVMDSQSGSAVPGRMVFPEQMVNAEGTISIPFAGSVPVVGYTLKEIESHIVRRLTGKANAPQVLVRVVDDASSTVTVVGDVAKSIRMPLTPKRERLLDALAEAGGVRESVDKASVQVTRGRFVHALPLDTIIRDPSQNIELQSGDVITLMNRPMSFTVFGATGKSEEVDFEAKGISLTQALARVGGLNDARADATGVFIFRQEHPWVFSADGTDKMLEPGHRVPVVYRLDLKDPGSYFIAQEFPVRDRDVLFVANASSVGLKKFLNVVLSISAIANAGDTVLSLGD